MLQRFERPSMGNILPRAAFLAALAASAAQAGDVPPGRDFDNSPCGSPGETCARINGYVKAGSDAYAPVDSRANPLARAPLLAGAGALGRAAADSQNRGMVLLRVVGDDSVR